jgi:signal transduction histidine kinase
VTDERLRRALETLQATRETDRLAAARSITRLGCELSPEDYRAVQQALARETVPWVRGALAEIVAASDHGIVDAGVAVPAPSWDADLEGLDPAEARQVINTSTKRVLHEVSAVVGRAKLAASADLGTGYADSETARQLEFLSDVCAGLRTLSAATQVPELVEFDLAQELVELARSVADEMICPVRASGHGPFIVTSDKRLLRVAVRNILINAVEATLAVGAADESRAVTLTWGVSADGFHATVIDRGPGPPGFLAAIRKPGVSTKEGHPGFGLATASEAMRSLGGSVQIRRNDRGGATVVLAWTEDV